MTAAPSLPDAYRLLTYDRLPSSNDEAKRLAREGAEAGTVIWAREQTAGRGRRGRQWIGILGNLFVSFILRPDCQPAAAAQVGFAAALGLTDAIAALAPPDAELRCKWPNDVLLNRKKVAGILLESETGANARLDWLVVGIGVNVVDHPMSSDYPATSLRAEACTTADSGIMLESLARHFLGWCGRWRDDGFAPIRAAWLERAFGVGDAITVRLDHERLEGRFVDLDADGALALATASGTRRIAAGDVFPAMG
jgi:BirA family biotin operon repressor/biotin-[acetyl-CoA-carboxylase] ligase